MQNLLISIWRSWAKLTSETKIGDFNQFDAFAQNIFWFQIAMKKSCKKKFLFFTLKNNILTKLVHIGQALKQLKNNIPNIGLRK